MSVKRYIMILLGICCIQDAFALLVRAVHNHDAVSADIAQDAPTRIAVEGDRIIDIPTCRPTYINNPITYCGGR
ncbi:MAG: hypothetical protein A3J38_10130 [Gammaproteobacteria bacterium RIFCSPHIGHO2_12_FULL_45_9]|nr:MAG: hypothetical protein A3J38_10130 [Gammaproteobacteria bacterium RIFCSPHIGHO2_12_FULL_45_9]